MLDGRVLECRDSLEKPCIELPPKFDSESFNTSANTSAICVHIPAAPSRGTSTLPGFLAIRA